MRRISGTCCCLALLVIAGTSGGCRDKEQPGAPASAPAPAASATSGAPPPPSASTATAPPFIAPSPAATGTSSSGLSLSIVPALPRANDCIQAVFGNASGDLTLQWLRNGKLIPGASTATICGKQLAKGDILTVTASGASGTQSASVTVRNTPPQIVRLLWRPTNITRGIDLTATAEGIDGDGDAISYTYRWLINGSELREARDATLPGTAFRGGDKISIEVTPYDGQEQGQVYRSGELVIVNSPPRFVTNAPNTVTGAEYVYEARAEDADGDALTYRLEAAPPGMTIDAATGSIRWPLAQAPVGEHKIRIVVQDPSGAVATQNNVLVLGRQ